MVSQKQQIAARKNIQKAQLRWRSMSSQARAHAQPQGRLRKKPGTTREGRYYRIVVRPKEEFRTFRMHDVGRKGHSLRLSGRRPSGSWDTEAWLINKKDAHQEGEYLIADDPKTKEIFHEQLATRPVHVKGDIFHAKPRKNVPEAQKPTRKQRRARKKNIARAQEAHISISRTGKRDESID